MSPYIRRITLHQRGATKKLGTGSVAKNKQTPDPPQPTPQGGARQPITRSHSGSTRKSIPLQATLSGPSSKERRAGLSQERNTEQTLATPPPGRPPEPRTRGGRSHLYTEHREGATSTACRASPPTGNDQELGAGNVVEERQHGDQPRHDEEEGEQEGEELHVHIGVELADPSGVQDQHGPRVAQGCFLHRLVQSTL